ncbi:MAG TPA: hypothetical protein VHZ02_10235, partial [Acidimicrobiales bacterium]|nr:hypothetical protein [Acidimicrobiales bacterium]
MALAARAPSEGTGTKGRDPQVESALDNAQADLMATVIEAFLRRHPGEDTAMIEGAAETAAVAHAGQVRRSGEPY